MTPKPEAPADSVNGRLADYLATKKEAILGEWLKRVRGDQAIIPTGTSNIAARLLISTRLHGFVDEMMVDAAEEYLWAQLSLNDRLSLGKTKCQTN